MSNNFYDRRKNLRLRALFDEAYARVEPSLASQAASRLPIEWTAFLAARATYPQLSPLDLFQFAMAAQRVFRRRFHDPATGQPA